MTRVNLEQAKRLHELGYPQEGSKMVVLENGSCVERAMIWSDDMKNVVWYTAPDVEELLDFICTTDFDIKIFRKFDVSDCYSKWSIELIKEGKTQYGHYGPYLMDSLLFCIEWILENKKNNI